MRVHSIEAIPIEVPLGKNFGGSTYTVLTRCAVITRMRTDEGLVSEVYNGDNREHGRQVVRLIHDELAPRVKGMSLFEGERIWEVLFALTHAGRDRKILLEAIACVDCALWDLVGKALGKSVCVLLGGYRTSLAIISIGGYYLEGKTHADIGREIEAYRRAGMAGCKFKVGGLTPEQDAERVATARDAAGPEFILAADANRGWSPEEAVRVARLAQHLLAAVPHGTYVECFADPERDPVWQAMWANRPPIKDGMLEVASDPGFGLILDEGMVRRYRVD